MVTSRMSMYLTARQHGLPVSERCAALLLNQQLGMPMFRHGKAADVDFNAMVLPSILAIRVCHPGFVVIKNRQPT